MMHAHMGRSSEPAVFGAVALGWAIWLSRNDVVFNRNTTNSFMQVIFKGWIKSWLLLLKKKRRAIS